MKMLRVILVLSLLGCVAGFLYSTGEAAGPKQAARLRIWVPEDARVEIDGVLTMHEGEERRYQSPPLTPGEGYEYTLKITWNGVSVQRKVAVTPGRETVLDLRPDLTSRPVTVSKDEGGKARYRRPSSVPAPEDNQPTAPRVELGRKLFFDPRLSGSDWISCASCHNPGLSWTDGLDRSLGHGMQRLNRHTPTLLNVAWSELLFWDGRAGSLEEQALGPISAPGEMNLPLEKLPEKVRAVAGYRALFEQAYPGQGITKETIARAIASYERTMVSAKAPFDNWIDGDEEAIDASAQRGFQLFTGKASCFKCHDSWRFTDDSFHDIGLPGSDLGRGEILKGIAISQNAFKTPTLRNIDRRAPYMHDGQLKSLEDVIDMYNQGGKVKRPSLSREIKPLGLTIEEKRDLLAFLRTLTSQDAPVSVPTLPR